MYFFFRGVASLRLCFYLWFFLISSLKIPVSVLFDWEGLKTLVDKSVSFLLLINHSINPPAPAPHQSINQSSFLLYYCRWSSLPTETKTFWRPVDAKENFRCGPCSKVWMTHRWLEWGKNCSISKSNLWFFYGASFHHHLFINFLYFILLRESCKK